MYNDTAVYNSNAEDGPSVPVGAGPLLQIIP